MGDFRRLVDQHFQDFRDAIISLHEQEINSLRAQMRTVGPGLQDGATQRPTIVREGTTREAMLHQNTDIVCVDDLGLVLADPLPVQQSSEDQSHNALILPGAESLEREIQANTIGMGDGAEAEKMLKETQRPDGHRYLMKDLWVSKYPLFRLFPKLESVQSCAHPRPQLRESTITTESTKSKRNCKQFPCIIDPDWPGSVAWGWISGVALMYDLVFLPVDAAFDAGENTRTETMAWLTRIFWTLDMLLSCVTGIYISGEKEMRFRRIVMWYSRTWLPIDLSIVSLDWAMCFMSGGKSEQRHFTLMRIVRLARLIRLMRLGKLRKNLFDLVDGMFSDMPTCIPAINDAFHILIYLLMMLHLLACTWYFVGRSADASWARASVAHEAVFDRYLTSIAWTLTLLHESNEVRAYNPAERGLACATALVTLLLFSFVVARATYAVFAVKDSTNAKLVSICWRFRRNRKIPPCLANRIHQYLRSQQNEGIGEQLAHESLLLASLPATIQVDISAEVRAPTLTRLQFFADMHWYNSRALRKICHAAVTEMLVLDKDVAFAPGDGCTQMFFVTRGSFTYFQGRRERLKLRSGRGLLSAMTATNFDFEGPEYQQVTKGTYLCEPALWTTWEHKGDLEANKDSLMLAVSADRFEEAIRHNHSASMHALMYARHFVWYLNHSEKPITSDLFRVDLPIGSLEEELFHGSEDEHFMFISHFKKESGTEAAMMAVDLDRMIREDLSNAASEFRHPVFIDSENLRDLASLEDHVQKSRHLLLLLTPGVLSRPWCLVEIVHAIRSHKEILPIEIQRPGTAFEYPTEALYSKILAGEALKQDARDLLHAEGITLVELVESLRVVFRKISLRFSPHRSVNIRRAELLEILGACGPIPWTDRPAVS